MSGSKWIDGAIYENHDLEIFQIVWDKKTSYFKTKFFTLPYFMYPKSQSGPSKSRFIGLPDTVRPTDGRKLSERIKEV